ncbi:MAG TPA: hypothetical protein QGI72_03675 [Poseidonia sp.]|nr:hypothetical protein [Poseidonia sp.]
MGGMKDYIRNKARHIIMSDEVTDNLNTETKKTRDYWYGLLIPICLGLGVSFFSLIVLLGMSDRLLDYSLLFFFALLFHMGHLILWPSSAAFIFFQGVKSGNLLSKNGALLSLKLYAVWMVVIIAPFAWIAYNFNGIV